MKFKDHSRFSFNGNGRILQAAISRNGASHDRVARSLSNFRVRKRSTHRVPNREMYDTISQLPYEGVLGRRGIDLGSPHALLDANRTNGTANLGSVRPLYSTSPRQREECEANHRCRQQLRDFALLSVWYKAVISTGQPSSIGREAADTLPNTGPSLRACSDRQQ